MAVKQKWLGFFSLITENSCSHFFKEAQYFRRPARQCRKYGMWHQFGFHRNFTHWPWHFFYCLSQTIHPSFHPIQRWDLILSESIGWETGNAIHITMGCYLTVKPHGQLAISCILSVKWESLDVFKQKTIQSNNLLNQFCSGILVYTCQKCLQTCLYMWHFHFQLYACVCVCVYVSPCDVWIMEAACWSPSRCQVAAGNMKVSQREGRGLVSKPDLHNQCCHKRANQDQKLG